MCRFILELILVGMNIVISVSIKTIYGLFFLDMDFLKQIEIQDKFEFSNIQLPNRKSLLTCVIFCLRENTNLIRALSIYVLSKSIFCLTSL